MSTAPTPEIDDGNFSHPAFQDYGVREIAESLYKDSGIEWPEWITDPANDPALRTPLNQREQQQLPDPDEPTPPVTPPEPSNTKVKIGDRELEPDQITSLLAWQDWFAANPDKAPTIANVVRGIPPQQPAPVATIPPTPEPTPIVPNIPEGFDATTPRTKFLLDNFKEIREHQNRLTELTQKQIEQAQIAKAQADMHQAMLTFKAAYPQFDNADLANIQTQTAALGIVGNLVANSPHDPAGAIVKALESGMWVTESTRAKLIAQSNPTPPADPDQARKDKLNQLGGSSGSTQRTDPRPRLDSTQSMKDAIARVVEPMFSNNN